MKSILNSKLTVFLVSFIVIMSLTTTAFATVGGENVKDQDSMTVEVSEMDLISQLQSMSDSELLNAGYTEKEIKEVRGITYASILKEAKKMSDDELENRGLTPTEINKVRNGAITPFNATIAAGKVSYTIKKISYSYSSKTKKTNLTTQLTWKWSKAPVNRLTDIVALTTSNYKFLEEGTTGSVNYRASKTGTIRKTSRLSTYTESSSRGTYSRFKTNHLIKASNIKCFAFDGNIKTSWQASAKVTSVGISGNYGHTVVTCTPNASFGANGGSISFTPSIKINQGTEASIVVKLK